MPDSGVQVTDDFASSTNMMATPNPPPYAVCAPLGTACGGAIIIVFEGCMPVNGEAQVKFFPDPTISAELCVEFAGGAGPTAGTAIISETQSAYVTVDYVPEEDSQVRLDPSPNLGPVLGFVPTSSPECSRPIEDESGDVPFYEENYCVFTFGFPNDPLLTHTGMATSASVGEAFVCVTIEVENSVINGLEYVSTPLSFPGCGSAAQTIAQPSNHHMISVDDLTEAGRQDLDSLLAGYRQSYLDQLDGLLTDASPAGLVEVVQAMKDWVIGFLTLKSTTPIRLVET
jgi:hypothetical protein